MGGEADDSGRLVNEPARPDHSHEEGSRTTMSVTVSPPTAANALSDQHGGSGFSRRELLSHEAPNLGVLGASVMGTSGAHNPTLTAQALARRTAEHLAKNWKAIVKG